MSDWLSRGREDQSEAVSLSLSKVCSMHYFEDLQVGSVEAETIRVRRRRCLSLPTAFAAEGQDWVKFAFCDFFFFYKITLLTCMRQKAKKRQSVLVGHRLLPQGVVLDQICFL